MRVYGDSTDRSVTEAPYNIKVTVCHTAGYYGEEYDNWVMLQQHDRILFTAFDHARQLFH